MAVKDIAEAIKLLGDVVKSTREIVEAANDGRAFLASRHPEAQQDLAALLGQMQRALSGLTEVTKVFTGFRFVYDGRSVDLPSANRELARFNNHVIAQKGDIATLQNRIRELKANCEKVRALRDKLDGLSQTGTWGSMFQLLGPKAKQRATELAGSLGNFYADDQRMIDLLNATLALAREALKEVEDALGPPGTANPYNVPAAAEILRVYATVFEAPERELQNLTTLLSDAKTALDPNAA